MNGRASHSGPSRSSSFGLIGFTAALAVTGCKGAPTESEPRESTATTAATATESTRPEVTPVKRVYTPSRAGCDAVPVFAAGEAAGSVCSDDAVKLSLTVIDLGNEWTPRVFQKGPNGETPEYRAKYLELANSPSAELALNGIAPQLSILAGRVADDARKRCDAAVDVAPIAEVVKAHEAAQGEKDKVAALKKAEDKAVVTAIQSQLVCAGFMKPNQVSGRITSSTQVALEAFRRRHMIVGLGLDADTVSALALGGEELAFRGLLRGLRERVAEAGGLLEDGTALEKKEPVLGRTLDLSRFAPLHEAALPNGAPDLVDLATDKAARELGWDTPDSARAFLAARGKDGLRSLRVALALPAAPSWHSAAMELRVEIDRGDVFYSPGAAAAARKNGEQPKSPTFVIYAKDGDREVALMRWATTIGGWKKERLEDGEIGLKYKESDVGDRVWRQVIAAPAWMPPESTPETDLVHEDKEGNLLLKRDLIQPGYRNAYGLVMLIHDEAVSRGDKTIWVDHGIRTHGSVDYRSIKKGTSHGCHRLYNQLALRLSGYLLAHRSFERRGKMHTEFRRTLELNDKTVDLEVPTRGYLYELDPPVPVKVLEGNVAGGKPSKTSSVIRLKADEPKKT